MTPFIQAKNITLVFTSKNRDPVTALNNFNLEVDKGEFVSIVGPSGCGKAPFSIYSSASSRPGGIQLC